MTTTDELDREVRAMIYRRFVDDGFPPVPVEIAAELARTTTEVEESLGRLAAVRALVLAPGTPYVWMANPLSALATPFRVVVGERSYWGNCIWDALGVVSMLGGEGRVLTSCPDCRDALTVEVVDGAVGGQDGGVAHFLVPAARWWDDIGFN